MPAMISKQLVFSNNPADLYSLTTNAVALLQAELPLGEVVISKVKMVLIELLTNALKHGGGEKTIIDISCDSQCITIIKTDTGCPLSVITEGITMEWPLPGVHHAGRIITIHGDGSLLLKGQLQDNCRVNFIVQESQQAEDVNALPEHFGLMIITRACDSFAYNFDIESCTNKFTANIALI